MRDAAAGVVSGPVGRRPGRVLGRRVAWTVWFTCVCLFAQLIVLRLVIGRVDPVDYPTRAAYHRALDTAQWIAIVVVLVLQAVGYLFAARRVGLPRNWVVLTAVPVVGWLLGLQVLWRLTDLPHARH